MRALSDIACALATCVTIAATCVTTAAAAPEVPRALVFDPPAQAKISKKFTFQHVLDAREVLLERDGEPPSSAPLIRLKTVETLVLNDEYRATSQGAPDVLRRYYSEIGFQVSVFPPGADEPLQQLTATSPFRGVGVVFTRVPDASDGDGYGRYFDGRESLEEALPGLGADLDMRVLLPSREVRVGDTWEVAPASMKHVLAGHGTVPIALKKGFDDPILRTTATGVGGSLIEVFGGEASGKIVARLASIDAQDGADIARIELDVDLTTKRDQTALARRQRTRGEFLAGRNVASSDVVFHFRGTGVLSWNLKERRLAAFQLAGDEEVTRDMRVSAGPESKARRDLLRMAGRYEITVEVGAPVAEVGAPESAVPAPTGVADDEDGD
ncbi:MAG: hypothetical protein ACKVWV_10280 [Planctomycetota bacterium]